MGVRAALHLPKEHGSWGMFYVPLVLGLIVARRFNTPAMLFVVAGTAIFLAREPFMTWWRSWRRRLDSGGTGRVLMLYGSIAVLAGVPLVFWFERYWLIVAGAAAMMFASWHADAAMRGRGRGLAAEIMAIAASTLAAPASYYAATGVLDWRAAILWLLATAYFVSSVFYVKMRVTSAHARDAAAAARARRDCGLYHFVLLFMVILLIASPTLPVFAAIAFLPIIVRGFWGVAWPTRELNLKRIGWSEVLYSLVFLVVIAGALS